MAMINMIIQFHLLNLVGATLHEHKFIIRLAQCSGFSTAILGVHHRGAVGIQGEELSTIRLREARERRFARSA